MKKNDERSRANRSILALTYGVVALFCGLILYFGYFLQFESENVINNSYNARLDRFSDRIVRGEILSADGMTLARTQVDEAGTETRVYPYGAYFDHVVGYSSRGKTGIEALANFYLLTSHVNLLEQTVNELSGIKNLGDRVITTLDTRLQQIAYDALGDRKGAVVAIEPDTGRILAMVSKPGYDPNRLAEDWEMLVASDDAEGPLLNRATQGLYPPGSTFKLVTALEYMREHPDDYGSYEFECSGISSFGAYQIKCYHSEAHGSQAFAQAFANSCNGAFADLGLRMAPSRLYALSEQLLFNRPMPLALPYKTSSYVMGEDAGEWEVLQTSIGQGGTQITPVHNAMLAAAVANGGTLMKPYLVDRVESAGGQIVKKFMPEAAGSLMTAWEADQLTALMRAVVTQGTGSQVRTDAYAVAGKTGSAEFETGKETHAWFIGFAPVEDPKLAISVIVEEGGSGGKVAAPIARSMFDDYFSR